MRMLITFLNNQLPYALQCTIQTVTHESEWDDRRSQRHRDTHTQCARGTDKLNTGKTNEPTDR